MNLEIKDNRMILRLSLQDQAAAAAAVSAAKAQQALSNIYTGKATGTHITYDKNKVYHLPTAPGTGAITQDSAGAIFGISQKIYHQADTIPPMPETWVRMGGSYDTGQLNTIYVEWISEDRQEYWIQKDNPTSAEDVATQKANEAVQAASIAVGAKATVENIGGQVSSDREAVLIARQDVEEKAGIASNAAAQAQEALQEIESGDYPKLQEIPNQFEILDEEGFLIFAIRANGEIYPPTVQLKSVGAEKLTDDVLYGLVPNAISSNIFEVLDDDGYLVYAINEKGEIYPPVQVPAIPEPPSPSPVNITDKVRASDFIQEDKVIKNAIWNQWIEPIAAWDGESLYIGGTGNGRGVKGELWLSKNQNGSTVKKKISVIRTVADDMDDHNAPSILLDQRPDAEFPLMWMQCDHNTHPLRVSRFTSKNPVDWENPVFNDIAQNVAYSQAWRYNDEIFVFSRLPGLPRPWRIAYSANNGATWATKTIFSSPASWLYCLGKVKEDGSGVNIACHGHPLQSSEQGIFFLELDFASGAIVNPANRLNPVIADLRQAISDPSFVPVDPFSVGLKLYNATGAEITRLWDIGRHSNGECFCVFNNSPSNARTMANFNQSFYKVVSFSLEDGAINYVQTVEEAGMPIENPAGGNMYFAGICVIGATNQFVAFTYKNQSQLDGENDTTGNDGKTVGRLITVNGEESMEKRVFVESSLKCIRPYSVANSDFFIYCEAEKFTDFKDFKSTIIIENLKEL